MSKTRLSGIIDHSSMGLNVYTEMPIKAVTFKELRKAFDSYARSNTEYAATIQLSNSNNVNDGGSNEMVERNVYILMFNNIDGTPNSVRYEFKKQGNNHFLNVGGNPACMVAGRNDIPVLVTKSNFEGSYNRATITFKYMHRIMYLVLDFLLLNHGFQWKGEDKRRLSEGLFYLTSYQLAWYSGDLGTDRNNLLNYLRLAYAGFDATSDHGVFNICSHLNLRARSWNDSINTTVEAWSGKNREFSLTWYAKDMHPDYDGKHKDRLQQLIRWDCTLNNRFLTNNNIKLVADLEKLYQDICDTAGYDVGFVRFISDKIIERIKLDMVISTDYDKVKQLINRLQDATAEEKSVSLNKVLKHWLNYGTNFTTQEEAAKFFSINQSMYSKILKRVSDYGLDLEIPRSYYEALLYNRTISAITREERSAVVMGSYNKAPRWDQLKERDLERTYKYKDTIRYGDAVVRVRKFSPIKVPVSKFHILNKV